MSEIYLAHWASVVPMGQQSYENSLIAALQAHAPPELHIQVRSVAGPRSMAAATVHLPHALLSCNLAPARLVTQQLLYARADLVHRMDLRLPSRRNGPEVLTIHDLSFEHYPDEGQAPPRARADARRAACVITGSEFSAHELRAGWDLPKVIVIPHGVDPSITTAEPFSPDELIGLGLPVRFVLHSGGATLRKNLGGLADAWQRLCTADPEISLLLLGPPDPRRDALFRALPRCRLLGYWPRPRQLRLLRAAAAVVVPSLYEGFGLPVLEAMAAAVPVVAAAESALVEVSGDAALVVPATGEGLAAGLLEVLSDASSGRELVARGTARVSQFSWERSARAHAQIYQACT